MCVCVRIKIGNISFHIHRYLMGGYCRAVVGNLWHVCHKRLLLTESCERFPSLLQKNSSFFLLHPLTNCLWFCILVCIFDLHIILSWWDTALTINLGRFDIFIMSYIREHDASLHLYMYLHVELFVVVLNYIDISPI